MKLRRKTEINNETAAVPAEMEGNGFAHQPHKTGPTVSLSPSKCNVDIWMRIFDDFYNMGNKRALEERALEVDLKALQPALEHMSSIAKQTYRLEFNVSSGQLSDQLRAEQNEKNKIDLKETELMKKHSGADLAEKERDLARMPPLGKPPAPPSWLLQAAALSVISFTVAVPLHDRVFTFDSEFWSWFGSVIVGGFCGKFIVSSILYNPEGHIDSVTADKRNWVGLIAGLVLGIAFFAARLQGSDSQDGDWVTVGMFALGMTLLEIAIVISLHGIAERYRKGMHKWRQEERAVGQLSATMEVARKHFETCQLRCKELEGTIEEHIQYVDERQVRHDLNKEIEAVVVNAYTHGYSDGVASNRGGIIGVKKGGAK